jgi:hypothetical protein
VPIIYKVHPCRWRLGDISYNIHMEDQSSHYAVDSPIPAREYALDRDWRDTRDLCEESEQSIYVNQNHADVSRNGETLNSDGFMQCTGVLAHNLDTGEAYLAHVSDWRLNEDQYDQMRQIGPGRYMIKVISGDLSLFTSSSLLDSQISSFAERFQDLTGGTIESFEDISVKSGRNGWSMSYKPVDQTILVYTKTDRMVREYSF